MDMHASLRWSGTAALAVALGCERAPTQTSERVEPAAGSEKPRPAPVLDALEQARRATVCADAGKIGSAVEQHRVMEGTCPADVETLVRKGVLASVPTSAPSWSIACTEQGVMVMSPGKDGKLGTDDDVGYDGARLICTP
jgi:hypothetical protein